MLTYVSVMLVSNSKCVMCFIPLTVSRVHTLHHYLVVCASVCLQMSFQVKWLGADDGCLRFKAPFF